MSYELVKALHIISMVAWFAGLFYIFRLFVYHAKHQTEPAVVATLTVMERKLIYIIMHPAMLLTLVFGIMLIVKNPAVGRESWFSYKLLLVLVLIGYQIFAGRVHKRFARGDVFLSEKACRLINEIPTVILIGAVILAVVKPFRNL